MQTRAMPFLDTRDRFRQRLGAYRAVHTVALVATQAAVSRLLTIRNANALDTTVRPNTGVYLAVTSIRIRCVQTGAHTAAILDDIGVRLQSGFTADDNTNASQIAGTKLDSGYPTASASVTRLTFSGVAAGMTGGTWTNGGYLDRVPIEFQATMPTAAQVPGFDVDILDTMKQDVGHPVYLAPAEGISIENTIVLGAAAAASVYIMMQWEEFTPLGL